MGMDCPVSGNGLSGKGNGLSGYDLNVSMLQGLAGQMDCGVG